MEREVSVLLSGIGGYGRTYVDALLDYKGEKKFSIAGMVDPVPEHCNRLNEIKDRNIPIFSTMEDFYAHRHADLAIISSPIQYHCSQTCTALSNGSNVLCEKPVAATVQDVHKMIDERNKSGKFVAVGYQWSHSSVMQSLKKDIQDGLLGKPLRFKTIVLWPRNKEYYSRGWAGKLRDKSGAWILDSVANNATAHYLHNMFYVLGDKRDTSAKLQYLTAELYRANKIENYDTAAVRVTTDKGVEILFLATHAVNENLNPTFCYEFENATVEFINGDSDGPRTIIAKFRDGTVKEYGDPNAEGSNKLWMAIDAAAGEKQPLCSLEAASAHTICINGMQQSVGDIPVFPQELINYDERQRLVWVEGLNTVFKNCYENWSIPSELGIPWAKKGDEIYL